VVGGATTAATGEPEEGGDGVGADSTAAVDIVEGGSCTDEGGFVADIPLGTGVEAAGDFALKVG
jgi:hypothetical protein